MDESRMVKRIFKGIIEIKEAQAQILAKLAWVEDAQREYEAERAEMQALAKAAKAAEAEVAKFPGKAEKPKAKPKAAASKK